MFGKINYIIGKAQHTFHKVIIVNVNIIFMVFHIQKMDGKKQDVIVKGYHGLKLA
jgi:hydroxypyruvate isomerase